MPSSLSLDTLNRLREFDTPTICNALEVACPERRGVGYTTRPLVCLRPAMPPIIGYARTAAIRAQRPSEDSAAEQRQRRLDYYAYVDGGPKPSVIVMQDLDPAPGYGSFWGEVNSHVHRGLGAMGLVTDGSIRDIDQNAEGFQMLAGMIGPSHAHVRVEAFDLPVEIAGMAVAPGDLIHADQHGAVVVPANAVAEIPAIVERLVRKEAVIIDASKRPDFDFETLARAMSDSDDIH